MQRICSQIRYTAHAGLTTILVAMTRPKRHLCVIGDSETVSRGSQFLKRWMKFLEDNADLRYPSLEDLKLG